MGKSPFFNGKTTINGNIFFLWENHIFLMGKSTFFNGKITIFKWENHHFLMGKSQFLNGKITIFILPVPSLSRHFRSGCPADQSPPPPGGSKRHGQQRLLPPSPCACWVTQDM